MLESASPGKLPFSAQDTLARDGAALAPNRIWVCGCSATGVEERRPLVVCMLDRLGELASGPHS